MTTYKILKNEFNADGTFMCQRGVIQKDLTLGRAKELLADIAYWSEKTATMHGKTNKVKTSEDGMTVTNTHSYFYDCEPEYNDTKTVRSYSGKSTCWIEQAE